jgi:DNA adenine methylase
MIPYIGGKKRIANWLISQFAPHKRFVEVFGGGGVILSKPPVKVEIYNDIDMDLVNLFRVVRDKEKSRELFRRAKWVLHSRAEFFEMREMWRTRAWEDDIQHALCFAFYMSAGRCGKRSGMSFKMNKSDSATAPASWQAFLKRIVAVWNRLSHTIIEALHYKELIEKYDTPETFFYLDPPYIKSDNYYCVNWKTKDHMELAATLKNIKGRFALSYYDGDFVRSLYPWCSFATKDVQVSSFQESDTKRLMTERPRQTELLIMNYQQSQSLTVEDFINTAQ